MPSSTARSKGPQLLRLTLGIVFLWFGGLKVTGHSPADHVVHALLPFVPKHLLVPAVGVYECILGLGLLLGLKMRLMLVMFWVQVLLTLSLVFVQPKLVFQKGVVPLLTMEGEFVIKNLVLLAAGVVLAGYMPV